MGPGQLPWNTHRYCVRATIAAWLSRYGGDY